MIEFEHVSAAYELETPIVSDLSFRIEDGDFVAFVGTNGAGKSTTMRLINGLLKPTSGCVRINGRSTTDMKISELARNVGFLFQNPDRQICCKTVREEMLFGLRAQGRLDAASEARVDELLERFGLDGQAEPFLLNRGARQLLALLSIVVPEPPVLILDEPTTGLDYRECELVMQLAKDLNERGRTIVMVCHDMEVVGDFAKRVIALTAGRVVADGPTFDVLRDPEVLAGADLLAPQIAAISMDLVQRNPELRGSAVEAANDTVSLAAAVMAFAGKGGER